MEATFFSASRFASGTGSDTSASTEMTSQATSEQNDHVSSTSSHFMTFATSNLPSNPLSNPSSNPTSNPVTNPTSTEYDEGQDVATTIKEMVTVHSVHNNSPDLGEASTTSSTKGFMTNNSTSVVTFGQPISDYTITGTQPVNITRTAGTYLCILHVSFSCY